MAGPITIDYPYHVIKAPDEVTRAAIYCYSSCGPIELKGYVGKNKQEVAFHFRPESPIYQIVNSGIVGNCLFELSHAQNVKDTLIVSFLNNTGGDGTVELLIVLNYADQTTADAVHRVEAKLKTGLGISYSCAFLLQ